MSWRPVHTELARDTRVCAYDRAGILWSETGPEPRSAARAVAELDALLREAEISEPVVLVGHSLGGQFAVQFAHHHPDRIAGLVLVDASHPAMLGRLPAEIRDAFVPPGPLRTVGRVAAALGILRIAGGSLPPIGWRPEWSREYMRVWHEMQDSLAIVFPEAQRSVVEGSDHMIHWNAPEVVIHAVRGVLSEARQFPAARDQTPQGWAP